MGEGQGDTIFIEPGVHSMAGAAFETEVHIVGLGSPLDCIITGSDEGGETLITLSGGGSVSRLTLNGGTGSNGGAIYLERAAVIENCLIFGNRATPSPSTKGDGGGIHIRCKNATIRNCILFDNHATRFGGGIYISPFAENARITNCTIFGNTAIAGGGIHSILDVTSTVDTVTFVLNSIISNNTADNVIFEDFLKAIDVTFSNAGDEWALYHSSNIAGDPGFVDPYNFDFALKDASVCIDAGYPDVIYLDKDGSRNDLGAFGGPASNWD